MERWVQWWVIVPLLLSWMLRSPVGVHAQAEQTFKRFSREVDGLSRRWEQEVTRVGDEYQRQATIVWEQYRAQIDRLWDTFRRTTATVWADYSDDTAARTVVDFAQGTIDVEVIVSSTEPNALHKAKERVKEQFLETFAKQERPGRPVLEGQLQTQTGEVVAPQNVERFAEVEVQGAARLEKRFQSQDGSERLKVTTRLPMTHGHTHHRATWYIPLAVKYGQERQVSPARILAIMHTESAFNPFARSTEGAVGLMQLIPNAGARDAYQALYGAAQTVSVDYLYNPEHNTHLGTVYVTLLRDRYLEEIRDPQTRDHLVICAYNWGIGNIKRLLRQLNRPSREEVVAVLRRDPPQATRDYLDRVLHRSTLYEPMVAGR
jgi:membrane-bound lytic murein transglycosylase C